MSSRLRLRGHDYSEPGTYFITICITDRLCLLGDVIDEDMRLSPAGLVVECWWDSIARRFPSVLLDEMIVMPNHLHGIVMLGANVEPGASVTLPKLSDIVGWLKSKSTTDYILGVRTEGWTPFPGTLWQPGFYDHIVGSDRELKRIRAYIEANPSQWHRDEENPQRDT